MLSTLSTLAALAFATCSLAAHIPSTVTAGPHHVRAIEGHCTPFRTSFPPSHIGQGAAKDAPFVSIGPRDSYDTDEHGLHLFLDRPHGKVKTTDGVNDRVAEGATMNSTFSLLYGRVTYTLTGVAVPGVVTAAILIADAAHDEIDVELLGGAPHNWQTNVFAPRPHDTQPLYGLFGGTHGYPTESGSATRVDAVHAYTIDWSAERITWSVDGAHVRTLRKEDTRADGGGYRYPMHAARLQLGIWDASAPAGTAAWAHGPINWDKAPHRMAAVVKSVEVECPYN